MTIHGSVEGALCGLGLYKPARDTYQRLLNRGFYGERVAARRFFRPLVPRGGLVFDIGANRGLRSELFLELGARVVAVDPLPELAELIRRRYGHRRLVVEACAVGETVGVAVLHVGADDAHSTLSDQWIATVGASRWDGTVQVPVRTLDDLVREHGLPAFVKLDVEGFEAQALSGLSFAPDALSFEFQSRDLDPAVDCLRLLGGLGRYRFRVTAGEELAFADEDWTGAASVLERVRRLGEEQPGTHGDVFAVLA